MQIPISNLFHILCYAWDYLPKGSVPQVGGETVDDPVNLFAHVLATFINRINRGGIQQGYVDFEEEGSRLKGKLDITATISRALLKKGKVACRFDEFSPNILPNQIIKTTALRLLTEPTLRKAVADDLFSSISKWIAVTPVELEARMFRLVNIQRQNREYGFLMNVCELIFDTLIPSGNSGTYRFQEFLRDENIMRKVFENFIRNFLKRHCTTFPSIGARNYEWAGDADSMLADELLPQLKTDVSLVSENRYVVVEVKYVPGAVKSGMSGFKDTLRSSHLYQLMSYLTNIRAQTTHIPEGVLVYPAMNDEFPMLKYHLLGHQVTVYSLNLNRKWEDISSQLLSLVA